MIDTCYMTCDSTYDMMNDACGIKVCVRETNNTYFSNNKTPRTQQHDIMTDV